MGIALILLALAMTLLLLVMALFRPIAFVDNQIEFSLYNGTIHFVVFRTKKFHLHKILPPGFYINGNFVHVMTCTIVCGIGLQVIYYHFDN